VKATPTVPVASPLVMLHAAIAVILPASRRSNEKIALSDQDSCE
jgi:hypothetical protein